MKSLIYCISIILFTITAHTCNQVQGNGNIIKKVVEITDYDNLKIAGKAEIIYEQKDTLPYLQIEIDENLFSLLDIESENGKLSIKANGNKDINPTKFIIRTNSKELASLNMAGSNSLHLNGTVKSDSLNIILAGSSRINADSIIVDNIKLEAAGSGNINLCGTAQTITCSLAGSSELNILELKAENVKCSIAGSGDIATYAEKTLYVSIAGSGKISYKGNPEISKKIAGSGKIINLNQ